MSGTDLVKLLLLSALWGCSFIFLRIAVPEVGPLLAATLRTSLGGIVLTAFVVIVGIPMNWQRNLKPYALIGFFAGVVPFCCFSFAALHLPAAHSAVLNSTSPLFGAVFSVIWLAERLTLRKLAGLGLGITGVAILVGAGAVALNLWSLVSIAACLLAAASYALSTIVVKKTGRAGGIHPIAMATGSLAMGGLMLAPTIPFSLPPVMPSMLALGCITALSILSSGVAQAVFIPLIVKIGPTRAMCVSFLIPLFSMAWGYIFLGEPVGTSTLLGAVVVLAAMGMVLWSSPPEPKDPIPAEA
ncbi:MAG: hypothetical protein V7606_949 [Burkholderiales bacterium]